MDWKQLGAETPSYQTGWWVQACPCARLQDAWTVCERLRIMGRLLDDAADLAIDRQYLPPQLLLASRQWLEQRVTTGAATEHDQMSDIEHALLSEMLLCWQALGQPGQDLERLRVVLERTSSVARARLKTAFETLPTSSGAMEGVGSLERAA